MSPTPDAGPHAPALLVDRPPLLLDLCSRLQATARVALDTEGNSLHAYRERTCVVQLSTEHESAIIDPLVLDTLEPLRAALVRPGVELVLHGGDYDIAMLSRDHGFAFGQLFDTMLAATLLGEPKVGLADLAAQHLGVALDKSLQKADWAERPLGPRHLAYLQGDTQWLLALRDLLGARLVEQDLVEEAEIEFRRLAGRRPRERLPEGERWREQQGAEALGEAGRAALAAAWAWREEEGARRNVPTFKVLPPQALVLVAREAERAGTGRGALAPLYPRDAQRHGAALSAAVEHGLAEARAGRAPAALERPRASEEERQAQRRRRAREEALRDWRRAEAAARKVPNVVVLPNPALEWLSGASAVTLETLASAADIGPKRVARYGEALVTLLAALP